MLTTRRRRRERCRMTRSYFDSTLRSGFFFHDSAATAMFCDTNDGVQLWFMTSAFGPGRAASRAKTQYGEISGVNLPLPFTKTILTANNFCKWQKQNQIG